MSVNLSPNEWNNLSLYLDNALDVRQREALKKQLQTNPELRAGLTELRQVKTILKHAPRRRAPRSFVLSPGMVERQKRWTFPRLFPSLSFGLASVVSIILAVVMFTSQTPVLTAQAPMMMAVSPESEAAGGISEVDESPAPIIIWGNSQENPQVYKSVPDEAAGGAQMPAKGIGGGPVPTEPPLPPAAEKSIPQPTEEVNPDLGIQEIGTPAADSYVPLETAQEPVAAAAPSVAALPTEIFPAATAEPPIPTATTEPPVSTETLPAVSENANPILGIQPTSETIPAQEAPIREDGENPPPSGTGSPIIPWALLVFGGICAVVAIISFRKVRP